MTKYNGQDPQFYECFEKALDRIGWVGIDFCGFQMKIRTYTKRNQDVFIFVEYGSDPKDFVDNLVSVVENYNVEEQAKRMDDLLSRHPNCYTRQVIYEDILDDYVCVKEQLEDICDMAEDVLKNHLHKK